MGKIFETYPDAVQEFIKFQRAAAVFVEESEKFLHFLLRDVQPAVVEAFVELLQAEPPVAVVVHDSEIPGEMWTSMFNIKIGDFRNVLKFHACTLSTGGCS